MRRAKLSAAALARLEHDVRTTNVSFRELGEKYGLSRQRVAQLAERWQVNARKRWEVRRQEKRREIEGRFDPSYYPLPTRQFAKRAARAGLTLSPLVTWHRNRNFRNGNVATTALKVNGRVCLFHLSAGPSVKYRRLSGEEAGYYGCHVSKRTFCKPDFHVLIFGEARRRFVIVPTKAIKTETIYVPMHKRTAYNNRKPVVDYLQYENRFELLKGAKRA
jgi:hypothetical protein